MYSSTDISQDSCSVGNSPVDGAASETLPWQRKLAGTAHGRKQGRAGDDDARPEPLLARD